MTEARQTVWVAATFTAEPLGDSLDFWMAELGESLDIRFAPYAQLFQELLDPSSQMARNHGGINVALVRFEDWRRLGQAAEPVRSPSEGLHAVVRELIDALTSSASRTSAPYILCICPDSPAALADPEWVSTRGALEAQLRSALDTVAGVSLISEHDVSALYPVADTADPYRDALAHIPFSPLYFAALGTAIARRISALRRPPSKVLVLDCDNTLWNGVLAEDGLEGIELDAARRALQEFAVAQHDAGMLICLNSRNQEEDVEEVFARRSDMPLRRDHIVSWRINWRPKSENLRSLAEELGLGLDSFVFLDDDPVVCAEVLANCPEALTLLLPTAPDRWPHFLAHVWALDRPKTTREDARRTELYRQDIARQELKRHSPSFQEFLSGLGLEIGMAPVRPEQVPRAVQLMRRTNQFNSTLRRMTESELLQLVAAGRECWAVEVRDRFGDYGLVGLIVFHEASSGLEVESFLLSCRALGRGVEHRMLARLGEIARQRGLSRIAITAVVGPRNKPAVDFLQAWAGAPQSSGGELRFELTAAVAAAVEHRPGVEPVQERHAQRDAASDTERSAAPTVYAAELMQRIATELSRPEGVLAAVTPHRRSRPPLAAGFEPPRTPVERRLATTWSDLLAVEPVGVDDNFFELGGHSLSATLLISRVRDLFGAELSLLELFEFPTIRALARRIDDWQIEQTDSSEIAGLLDQLENLTDDEVDSQLAPTETSVERRPPSLSR